jgi:hypothetical protein
MKNIVLITREKAEKVSNVSVYLCENIEELSLFCRFVNRLSLEDGEEIHAKRIKMNKDYALESTFPLTSMILRRLVI